MYKIGMSTCTTANGLENGEMFRDMMLAGITAAEISYNLPLCDELDYKKIGKTARETGTDLWSFHLPFAPFDVVDITAADNGLRASSIKINKELIRRASDIGIDKFVIHPSIEPIADAEREEYIKRSMQSLSELADFAAECGAVIAVEDLPRSCLGNRAEEMLRLLEANDKLRVCFDTNHLTEDNNENFMQKLGDKIITVHVSDYDFINERHWLPGEGKLDWNMMMDCFEKIGYNGVWMYEVNLHTPSTIIRERELEYKDIFDNAKAVFDRKKASFCGTPKPNLGMWG